MFDKILIANRGEIACRVIKTARRMGVKTVAVYSDADANARHVAMADEAIHIGPPEAAQSYLVAEKILAAAKETGAQAIHPGYGFLSENAEFAESCAKKGVKFIGPSGDAIRAMGLKGAAKSLMEEAQVPVVPGFHGEEQDAETLKKAAGEIGYPVLIKAVAGGGGKGMRRVDSEADFDEALLSAQREGQSAFGNPKVLIEKFIEKPRHIEIQVFADSHGEAVHLFERDCSLQRRHQKVVEEAPAPDMPPSMREEMGAAAVRAAKAISYEGAGTIEFIVDVSKGMEGAGFYFMEMNTRLQVEHPVTEMITGQDLVEWQLRVASGEPLPAQQEDLSISGHALEVRLYAEDPRSGFLPAIGDVEHFITPDEEPGFRVETGIRSGDEVSMFYDPMIAKFVLYGSTRDEAIAGLEARLDRSMVAGLKTNLDFLKACISHEAFKAGDLDTGFIERHAGALVPPATAPSLSELGFAACRLEETRQKRVEAKASATADRHSPWNETHGWRLNLAYAEELVFQDELGDNHTVLYSPTKCGFTLSCGEEKVNVETRDVTSDVLKLTVDGHGLEALVIQSGENFLIQGDEPLVTLRRITHRAGGDEEAEGPGTILAPMPGKVLDLFVEEGAPVEKGTPLLVLEAMKMEHKLNAPRAGVVKRIAVAKDDQVREGAILIELDDEEAS